MLRGRGIQEETACAYSGRGRFSSRRRNMTKQTWKPGNMVYPLPAVMVSTADKKGNSNILTVAWTGTVCTNPPMAYISVRPERYSYHMIKESGEFVINLTTKKTCPCYRLLRRPFRQGSGQVERVPADKERSIVYSRALRSKRLRLISNVR